MTSRWRDLFERGRAESRAGNFAQAAALYQQALESLQDATQVSEEALTLRVSWGTALASTSALDGAIEMLARAHADALATFGPHHPVSVRAGLARGAPLFRSGRIEEAAELWLECERAVEAGAAVDDQVRTLLRNNLGGVHYHRGDHLAAIRCFEQALHEMEARLGPEHAELDRPLGNLALLSSEAGRPLQAETYARRALAIAERQRGAGNPELAATLFLLASILTRQDRLREALEQYRRGLTLLPENHYLRAYTGTNLASLYRDLGDTATARAYLDDAGRVADLVLDGADPVRAAVARMQAHLALDTNDHRAAWSAIERALVLEREVPSTTTQARITNRTAAAEIALATGDAARAEGFADEGLQLLDEASGLNDAELRARLHALRGRARSGVGRHREALADLTTALASERDGRATDGPFERVVLDARIRAHEALGDAAGALAAADAAVASLERSRLESYAPLDMRGRQRQSARGLAWFDLLLRDRQADRVQRSRRIEAWFTHHQAAASAAAATVRWFDQASDTQRAVASAYRAALRALVTDAGRSELDGRATVLARIAQLEREAGFGDSAIFEQALGPVRVSAVSKRLGPDERLVAIAWLEQHAISIEVTADGSVDSRVAGRTATLADDVHALRAHLQAGDVVDGALLARVSEAFMGPACLSDPSCTRLTVVPDGPAALLPWGWLVHVYREHRGLGPLEVEQAPSVRALVEARDHVSTGPASTEPPCVIADPDYGAREASHGFRGAAEQLVEPAVDYRRWLADLRLPRLQHAREEADVVRRFDPTTRVLTGPQASVEACLALRRPRILHIATHGFVYPGDYPGADGHALLRPVLALAGARAAARTPADAATAGFLPALAMAGIDLHGTELVFLSACDTSVGAVLPGEGVAAMPQALLAAGARSVIATLWRLADEDALGVARAVYRHLSHGATPAAALRHAQREARNQSAASAFVCWS